MGHTSSIDDILVNSALPNERKNQSPPAPEAKFFEDPLSQVDNDNESSSEKIQTDNNVVDILAAKPKFDDKTSKEAVNPTQTEEYENIFDDYGNEQAKQIPKTYTEDEVNDRINKAVRERLERMERNNPSIQQPNAQGGISKLPSSSDSKVNYDENNPEDWHQQLENFTIQTIEKRERAQAQRVQQEQEQKATREFEEKFQTGMEKFHDFREVVGTQPFTDAMTIATRAMKDPAAFIYAASKRHAPEIQRISQIQDPYTQMVEIGRLEERMKKTQTGTKAPKPMRTAREDAAIPEPVRREPTIEEMMAQADRTRMSRIRTRR